MSTRNRKTRRLVSRNTGNSSSTSTTHSTTTDSETITMEDGDRVEGGAGDFEEVEAPMWIDEMFGVETITGSKLTQIYTTFMGLHQFQQKNILCDVTVKVGDTMFHAHKAVLGASSSFFRTMFTSNFQESRESEVSVTGKPEAFKVILDYIYSCELTLSVDTVVDVLEMSHYLQLDLVMKRCEQFLIEELNNSVDLDAKAAVISLVTGRTYELGELIEAAKRCMAKKFVPTDTFLDLMTGELLEEILGRNDLKDEKQVFDTILAWLQHDWNKRKKFAPILFSKIRLGIVPVGHLSKTVFKNHPKLYAIKECGELIDKALEMFDDRQTRAVPLHYIEPSLFATRTMINAILRFGVDCGYYYDIDMTCWIELPNFPPLPEKDSSLYGGDSCVSTNGHLYVSRGTASAQRTRPGIRKLKCPQFLRLDMPNNRWVPLEPMITRRQNTCLVAGHHNLIYAIGGDESDFGHMSAEVYSPDSDTWEHLPYLEIDVDSFCKPTLESCTIYKGALLVYGRKVTYDEEDTSNHHYLMRYDRVNRVWINLMESMHGGLPGAIVGLVINDDKLYRIYCCLCIQDVDKCPNDGITVDEIVVDLGSGTARIAERQDQDLITIGARKKAFCVNQDVYVVYKKRFLKTGIQIPRNRTDPIELGNWNHLKQATSPKSVMLAQFMFDKQRWL